MFMILLVLVLASEDVKELVKQKHGYESQGLGNTLLALVLITRTLDELLGEIYWLQYIQIPLCGVCAINQLE